MYPKGVQDFWYIRFYFYVLGPGPDVLSFTAIFPVKNTLHRFGPFWSAIDQFRLLLNNFE